MTQNEVLERWNDLTSELGDYVYGKTVEQTRLVNSIQEGLLIIKYGNVEREYRNAVVNLVGRQIVKLEKLILGG